MVIFNITVLQRRSSNCIVLLVPYTINTCSIQTDSTVSSTVQYSSTVATSSKQTLSCYQERAISEPSRMPLGATVEGRCTVQYSSTVATSSKQTLSCYQERAISEPSRMPLGATVEGR